MDTALRGLTCAYLDVVVGVPVRVVYDDRVSGGQVDAQTPRPGGEQEGKLNGSGG